MMAIPGPTSAKQAAIPYISSQDVVIEFLQMYTFFSTDNDNFLIPMVMAMVIDLYR